MPTRPVARLLLAGAVVIAAAGCSRHAATEARADQTADDRGQVAQQAAPPVQQGDPFAARDAQATRRDAGAAYPRGEAPARAEEPRRAPRSVTVPAGAQLAVRLDATVSSASAASGQSVQGELAAPLEAGGDLVAAAGTPVEARVQTAVPSGRLARPARLELVLTSVQIAGEWVPVVTSSVARTGPTHTKHNSRFIAGGAAIGALVGQLLGGNHNSTLRGAAVGAAAGTGAAAATGKADVTIGAGEVLTFTLAQPLEVRG